MIRFRRSIGFALALVQLLASASWAIPIAAKSKEMGRPYPCMERPCGCTSYDECWAGDCCCFTLEEKIAWAAANGITPPDQAQSRLRDRHREPPQEPACPHCKAANARKTECSRSIYGFAVQNCHGSQSTSFFSPTPSIPPRAADAWRPEWSNSDFVLIVGVNPLSHSAPPLDPPPRD
jgi:hypothetical protein